MTIHELAIVELIRPEGGFVHAVSGVDELVKDKDGKVVTCGILHPVDSETEPEDCPVASRWTLLVSR